MNAAVIPRSVNDFWKHAFCISPYPPMPPLAHEILIVIPVENMTLFIFHPVVPFTTRYCVSHVGDREKEKKGGWHECTANNKVNRNV